MDTIPLYDERGPIVWSDMETSAISNTANQWNNQTMSRGESWTWKQ